MKTKTKTKTKTQTKRQANKTKNKRCTFWENRCLWTDKSQTKITP